MKDHKYPVHTCIELSKDQFHVLLAFLLKKPIRLSYRPDFIEFFHGDTDERYHDDEIIPLLETYFEARISSMFADTKDDDGSVWLVIEPESRVDAPKPEVEPNGEGHWADIRANDVNDEGFLAIDAWKADREEGTVIATVDTLSGRVYYLEPEARVDQVAQEVIQEEVQKAKNNHPYSVEELEDVIYRTVDYEAEEIAWCGREQVLLNLDAMGICEEMAIPFGFPEED